MNAFLKLKTDLLKAVETATFSINDLEGTLTKGNKVAYKAKTSDGKVITFWEKNTNDVVEATNAEETEFRVKPGVQYGETEDGLTPIFVASGKRYNPWA